MFVRFGCGCIGVNLGDRGVIIVSDCSTFLGATTRFRHYPGKGNRIIDKNLPGEPLTSEEEDALFSTLDKQLVLGAQYRELHVAMNKLMEPEKS